MCLYSRHAAVSVDANPLPSPERSTTTVQTTGTTVVSESQQCPAVVLTNEHRSKDVPPPQQHASECPRGGSQQIAADTNKTGSGAAVQVTSSSSSSSSSSSRPICPNLPYSPSCSPRFARRRPPLRECRVSVNVQSLDDPNVHQKLNQYKLIDSIGQVFIFFIFERRDYTSWIFNYCRLNCVSIKISCTYKYIYLHVTVYIRTCV